MNCESDLSIFTMIGVTTAVIPQMTLKEVCCHACEVGTTKPSPAPTVSADGTIAPTVYPGEKCLVRDFVQYMADKFGYDCTGDRCEDESVIVDLEDPFGILFEATDMFHRYECVGQELQDSGIGDYGYRYNA